MKKKIINSFWTKIESFERVVYKNTGNIRINILFKNSNGDIRRTIYTKRMNDYFNDVFGKDKFNKFKKHDKIMVDEYRLDKNREQYQIIRWKR